MGEFIILTDNTVDLPASWMEEREVDCEYLPCTVDGIVYDKKNKIEICEFYKKMREGSMPTTSQINPTQAETFFESFTPSIIESFGIITAATTTGPAKGPRPASSIPAIYSTPLS